MRMEKERNFDNLQKVAGLFSLIYLFLRSCARRQFSENKMTGGCSKAFGILGATKDYQSENSYKSVYTIYWLPASQISTV